MPDVEGLAKKLANAIRSEMEPRAAKAAPGPATVALRHMVLVNTPGRPIDGKSQHVGIVVGVSGDTVASVYLIPAKGTPYTLADVEREDLIDRTAQPNRAGWQF